MSPSPDNGIGPDNPGAGGGFPSAPGSGPDPRSQRAFLAVATIVQSARQLSMMFPTVSQEMRQITNLMYQVQQKITSSAPAPETTSPPA